MSKPSISARAIQARNAFETIQMLTTLTEERGWEIVYMNTIRPSLEDAFVRLTGGGVRGNEDGERATRWRRVIRDELEGIWHILLKDLKAYYFKPPNISWGIFFPLVLALAFTLRNPAGLAELSPRALLIAMAALFGTTSMEAIVITFEKRVGALERLMLAPVSLFTILVGKVLGGAVFGIVIAGVMVIICLLLLNMTIVYPVLFIVGLILTVLAHSALGALVAVSVRERARGLRSSDPIQLFPLPHGLPLRRLPAARAIMDTIASGETITEDEWWEMMWREVPTHGSP